MVQQKVVNKFRQKSKNGKVKVKLPEILDKLFMVADRSKVPKEELEFLDDQEQERQMFIGGLDAKITKRNVNRAKRQQKDLDLEEKRRKGRKI